MSAVDLAGATYKFYDNKTLSAKEKLGTITFDAYVLSKSGPDGNRHRVPAEEGAKQIDSGEVTKETVTIDLAALERKFTGQDCPKLMQALDLAGESLPLWWTTDFINASDGDCWSPVPPEEQKWIVGEFNCVCVGIDKCSAALCNEEHICVSWKDVHLQDKKDAITYGDIVGKEAAKLLGV